MSENNDCYWNTKDDPLGQVHGKFKYERLQIEYQAMIYVALQNGNDRMQELTFDRIMRSNHGDAWEEAKNVANTDYLTNYKRLNKNYEERTAKRKAKGL